MSEDAISEYICEKIKGWAMYLLICEMVTCEKKNNLLYLKTTPYNDLKYKESNKVQSITICLVNLHPYLGDVFMLHSDSKEGIYEESCKKGVYCMNEYTQVIIGTNKLKSKKLTYNLKDARDAYYLNIDWHTGLPLGDSGIDLDVKNTMIELMHKHTEALKMDKIMKGANNETKKNQCINKTIQEGITIVKENNSNIVFEEFMKTMNGTEVNHDNKILNEDLPSQYVD
jgi:hypothetical protein